MHKVFVLVCVILLVNTAYTAVSLLPKVPKPPQFEHEEGCYNKDLNMVVPYDAPHSPQDECAQYSCFADGTIKVTTCGVVAGPAGCVVIPGDVSKPYPDCCQPEIKCN
ncbi:la1-like protein 15 [Ostrinia furnacalis]|uniref:la1-like protein 15 n=1 Tax=Ostrinia furnacalis TaxID=93504 RepID=UPI00103FC74C|nr:la1-like protein 15 [Ostrinia furnacalis]